MLKESQTKRFPLKCRCGLKSTIKILYFGTQRHLSWQQDKFSIYLNMFLPSRGAVLRLCVVESRAVLADFSLISRNRAGIECQFLNFYPASYTNLPIETISSFHFFLYPNLFTCSGNFNNGVTFGCLT